MNKIGYFIHPITRERYEVVYHNAAVAGPPTKGEPVQDSFGGMIPTIHQERINAVGIYIKGLDSTNSDLFSNISTTPYPRSPTTKKMDSS